jgi:4'-phosphopantetheinyl transferase
VALAGDLVQVWLIRLDLPAAVLARLARVLDEDEQRRAGERTRDRDRFVAAHGAARVIIGARLGIPAGELRWAYGAAGKPELVGPGAGWQVNLSHSGALAALAISRRRPVGVDVQRLPCGFDPVRMATRFYPIEEARYVAAGCSAAVRLGRYVRLWARKEACVKAAGTRLVEGLRLAVRPVGRAASGHCAGGLSGDYRIRDLPAPNGFRAAVALSGGSGYRAALHYWPMSCPFVGTHGSR